MMTRRETVRLPPSPLSEHPHDRRPLLLPPVPRLRPPVPVARRRIDNYRIHADRTVPERLVRGLWIGERECRVVVVRLHARHAPWEEEAGVDVVLQEHDEHLDEHEERDGVDPSCGEGGGR